MTAKRMVEEMVSNETVLANMVAAKTAEGLHLAITELRLENEALDSQLADLQDELEQQQQQQQQNASSITTKGKGNTISKKEHQRLRKAQKDWIEKEAAEQEYLVHSQYRSGIARWELTVADTSN